MLVNVPLVDQLNESTTDGGPDEAARANCVPASLTAAVLALVPAAQIHGAPINGDALRDAVYPESYTGATDPARYMATLASLFGISMREYQSNDGNALVQHAIAAVQAHQPVSAAIPSMWGNDYTGQNMVAFAGGTHEVTFCDYDPASDMLTAMNPWPVNGASAFYQTQPATWWAERLVYGRVFTLSGGHPMSNVTPVWNAAAGTLAYPAHDGVPAITLDHGQAYYAQVNRQGRYPLAPGGYDGNDSVVYWNDGMRSRAVKANNWAVVLEDSGPALAADITAAATVDALTQQVAALKQQLADVTATTDAAGQAAIALLAKIKADIAA